MTEPLSQEERDEIRYRAGCGGKAGWEDTLRLLADLERVERERDEARAFIEQLKTEMGKAAFALANGWPLPEELMAARDRIAELEAKLARIVEEIESGQADPREVLAIAKGER